jgi:DNA mismatch repair protein MutS
MADAAATPLMRQYQSLKSKNPDVLLFFRLGDFYELFYDDARKAAPLLEVTLTQRQGIPMCGVPHHALGGYLAKLLKAGWRAAIAEQMQDPASTKGMVQRDVVRVVSPGTVLEEELLSAKQNNFLAAAAPLGRRPSSSDGAAPVPNGKSPGGWSLAALDMSTGEFLLAEVPADPEGSRLSDELARLDPREVLVPRSAPLPFAFSRTLTPLEDRHFSPDLADRALRRALEVTSLAGFGLDASHPALSAAGAILAYVENNQPGALPAVQPPRLYKLDDYLALDDTALRNLDLVPERASVRQAVPADGSPRTLWDVLDHTSTPMGGRKLKWWMLHPLRHAPPIRERQDRVEFFVERASERRALAAAFKDVADVERILNRLTAGGATGRDLNALRRTLEKLPDLRELFTGAVSLAREKHPLSEAAAAMRVPEELPALLRRALSDDPPFRLSDGGVIRDGFSPELDELRQFARKGRSWISEMEAAEKARTGIGSLKVGFTSVFGYYLEVSRANLAKVPPEWIRKQTLANAERFITPELKAQEDKILGADEKAKALEAELFAAVRADVLKHREALRRLADALAELDALSSLAEAAERGQYRRPKITDGDVLRFEKARHPVVERALGGVGADRASFVPNDAALDGSESQVLLVTGPNMGGKSTYLRQVALLTVMAQMGSFVPADEAEVGVVDRVFTRIGAGDNLAAGASTFLVEMQEVANILHNATPRSLVILDEVGRGTSTYDGVAVAWAVVEHLHRKEGKSGPKVLFATHYFELTALAERLAGVKNFHAAVREWVRPDGRTELVFLHQILPGPADRSYGVHVAQMAGLPAACVKRARAVLAGLEGAPAAAAPLERRPGLSDGAAPLERRPGSSDGTAASEDAQLSFFSTHPALEELKRIDADTITPLEALQLLHRLSAMTRKEGT